jgi:hypothetical protein
MAQHMADTSTRTRPQTALPGPAFMPALAANTFGAVGTKTASDTSPARRDRTEQAGQIVAVTGACGGAGASCMAAGIAYGLQRETGRAVLLDCDVAGAGLDVLLGIEDQSGARWGHMTAAIGEVDGHGVLASLPVWRAVPVLSMSRQAPVAPSNEVVLDVCSALLRAGCSIVLDLPRIGAWTAGMRALALGADHLLCVTPATVQGAAGATALIGAVVAGGGSGGDHDSGSYGSGGYGSGGTARWATLAPSAMSLLVREPSPGRITAEDLAQLTGCPIAGLVHRDRSMAGAIERGEGPVVKRGARHSRLGRLSLTLARSLAGGGAGAGAAAGTMTASIAGTVTAAGRAGLAVNSHDR